MATPTTSSKVNGFVVTKLQQTADRLRLETSKLRDSLRSERDAVRELRAKHAAQLRTERTAARRRQCELETQLKKDTVAATHYVVPINQCDQCSKLRASHEAELRREHAEQKKRESQLRTQLNEVRRNAMHSATDGVGCQHCIKSSKDITKLKELNKDLEERLHKTIEADKQKAADLRAQHEKHVIELSKITRIHKQDSHKLLEELKTKDRIIEQLRKNANGGAITEPSTQMRKLREDTKKTEQPNLLSSTAYDSKPEQIQQNEKDKIADLNLQNKNKEQMTCGGPGDDLEQNPETDTDSAVSSAPSSLSPQPCSPLNEDCVNSLRCTRQNLLQDSQPPTSLSPQPSEGYTTPPPGLWSVDHDYHTDDDNDSVTENELMMAKRQVRELERALLVTRASKSGHHVMALSDRVRQLEEHETELLRELGDLREQNELLEFRVFELAECHDKSSILESQWIEKHEACTGTDDDYLINQLNEDSVRNRLLTISNRTTNLEDKTCLQQIVLLLYGLDELTRRSKDVFNIDLHQENQEEDLILPHMGNNNGQRGHRDRLVAKVPPFTGRSIDSDDDRSSPVRNIDESLKSKTSCGTQTEGLSSVNEINDLSLNLTAEVRKLDRLRESIQVRNGNFGVSNFSDEQKNARQLEFYRDRVEVLERKVRVYESSGEQQVREIAERLSREVCLEAQVKQLTQTVQKLQSDNSRLEEERCELEEAENDTRLRCQRLESDKAQLERSKMSAKRKARDSRSQAVYWESMVSKYEERNYELEEKECELRHKLEVMERTFQAVLLFNMWKTSQNNTNVDAVVEVTDRLRRAGERDRSRSRSRTKSRSPTRDNSDGCTPNTCMTDGVNKESSSSSLQSYDMELLKCVQQLKDREQDLKKKIDELEHREAAYLETLQQADDIWAEMETGYKKQINEVRCSEANMRAKLQNMQKHQDCDCDQLEDSERKLKEMSKRLETEKCKLTNDNKRLEAELCDCRDEYAKTVNVQKQCQNDLVKERHRAEEYQQKAACAGIALIEAGKQHQSEMAELKDRLARVTNELFHLEVTNGELREEVDTLECKITELETAANQRCTQDAKVIRGLTDELNQRDKEVEELQQKCCANVGERLSSAMEAVKRCDACLNQVSRVSPNLMNTVEGIRTLCEIVGCNAQQPDTQARRRRFGRWL